MSNFQDLDLHASLLEALVELGYTQPTPVQRLAIPQAVAGNDLVACASTGTGKTAAFVLPSLHRVFNAPRDKWKGPRILILTPTRELALQVAKETEKFSQFMPRLRTVCLYGGEPIRIQKQKLFKPYEILVATPGRLLDHINQRTLTLSGIEILVLDEADRMVDMGFFDDVDKIASLCPKERQTLLFSATLSKRVQTICQKLQKSPIYIEVEKADKPQQLSIEQQIYFVDDYDHKMRILDHLLSDLTITQAIIFTGTIAKAIELSDRLQDSGRASDLLHGDMSQRERTRSIEKLRRGKIDILVATDVAARGIDVPTITHVINIDLPFQAEDYIHRIGRTGRAGASGTAITFVSPYDHKQLGKIRTLWKEDPLQVRVIEGMEPKKKKSPSKPSSSDRFKKRWSKPRRSYSSR